MEQTVCLRRLGEEHLPEVAELETLCFAEPWSENALRLLLGDGAIGVVLLECGRVVAYGGMTTVLDEGAVTNIAVHPDARRRGFGRAVTAELLRIASEQRIQTVFLEVRESNAAARALYVSLGFSECGVRKNFYRHPTESAIQMVFADSNEEKGKF